MSLKMVSVKKYSVKNLLGLFCSGTTFKEYIRYKQEFIEILYCLLVLDPAMAAMQSTNGNIYL